MRTRTVFLVITLLAATASLTAQSFVLDLPDQSQRATVTQRVGLTDISIEYHRPLVNKRKIFPGVVPYGEVWRAGANTNTRIGFAHPVSVEGQPLPAGIYGLHMIPNADAWTLIFSKQNDAWGSYTYDQKEDALRVNVKPQAAEMHEALTYTIDPVGRDAAIVRLAWEKTAVPFTVKVDVDNITRESLKTQLRGLAQYTWIGWNDAAGYLLQNKVGLDEALNYADRAVQVESRFETLNTKAEVLKALGRSDEAAAAEKQALEKANAIQTHNYGRQLQTEGKQAEAFAVFRANAKKNPTSWVTHVGMARVYAAEGKFDEALREISIAQQQAPAPQKQPMEALKKRLERKEDINK
jgi:tetratricopeptide (TPR) repeat protein